jgi:hypothetical protein
MSNIRNGLLLSVALAASLGATSAMTSVGPDAAGYTATDETAYSFVNIAATGIRTLALTDDGTTAAGIGFPFDFYGGTYSDLCISANGYLLFGGCTDAFLNQDLSGAPTPGNRPMIAPLWTDLTFLRPTADAVYYETLGAAPARQFVVQWNRAFPQNAPQPITLQVILSEGSNEIRFQYQTLDAGAGSPGSNGGAATVGICDADGASTGRCLPWSYNAAVLRSEMAVLVDPNIAPPPEALPGDMRGDGFIVNAESRYAFTFHARERASGDERASFGLTIQDRNHAADGNRGDRQDDENRKDHDEQDNRGNRDRFVSRTVTSVTFSDDPNIEPGRRRGPMADTVLFNGIGEWNSEPNYTYEVSARDEGEPGRHRESIRMTITSPSGAVVVQAQGDLAGGNIRSGRIRH